MLVKERIKLQPRTQTIEQPQTQIDYEELATLPLGAHFRARKKQISIRMDADLLEWFQAQPGKYQQLINKACRVYMHLNLRQVNTDTK